MSAAEIFPNAAASISGGTSPPTAITAVPARLPQARNAIATPCENPANTIAGRVRHFLRDARLHIRKVVGDRRFTILPRHPAGYNLIRAPLIKPVQPLDRDDVPALAAGNFAQTQQLRLGIFAVAVKTHQQRSRARRRCPATVRYRP